MYPLAFGDDITIIPVGVRTIGLSARELMTENIRYRTIL